VLDVNEALEVHEAAADSLLLVEEGSGILALAGAEHDLQEGTAALVAAGEQATLSAGHAGIVLVRATAGDGTDRHAPLGPRTGVERLDRERDASATGARSFQILLGPNNGSARATMFVGYVPPGKAPWHYHLYDEIVLIREGSGRLHVDGRVDDLGPGSFFRLRPRQVHIVENASATEELTLVGVFTPAGSPTAAYLPAEVAADYRFLG
jgi:quercetin dioxygenase-like cupin family protein